MTGVAAGLHAATFIVGPGGSFASVQQAVAAAQAGDTVRVQAGVYPGNIVLDRAITLEGTGRPVIRGDGRGSVICVTADRCAIRNFIIENSGPMLGTEDSGVLLKSSGNRIENNELRDVLFGVYFFGSSHNQVIGNRITGRAWLGQGERGAGIHIWNSTDNTILRNTITDMRDGMYLQNAYKSTITDNRIYGLRYGLHYMSSDDNKFEDNRFYDNVAGAAIMYSKRIEFRRNVFRHNRGFSSFGILFQDSEHCVAEDNRFVDNAVGIFMEALHSSEFRRNVIAANDIAIQAFSSASGNEFESNSFIDNLSPTRIIGRSTDTRWNGFAAGNYWSDYEGYDLDADGIGDVPFQIENVFEHLEGNYPRLRIYLFSPAAQALAVSEKMFPVIEGSREFDKFPLMKPGAPRSAEAHSTDSAGSSRRAAAVPLAMLAGSILVMVWGRMR
jgi:nitrous oxidase accessory protein